MQVAVMRVRHGVGAMWAVAASSALMLGTRSGAATRDRLQQREGARLYSVTCQACHQVSGQGLANQFPPLAGSEWVTGSEERLVLIILHGIIGEIEVEGWLTSELPTAELKREMKRVKGAGDYAAENVLKLVGRYDGLALDSWVRGKFARMHNGARKASDKKIERYYSRFAEWRGLALWCDMTRDWLEDEQSPLKW